MEAVAGQPPGVNMPTTRPQTATMRKKIRPSSAGPNLQSHPCYSTSLFDSNRPSTASSSSLRTQEKGALPVRPVTQAGPRRQYRAPQADVRLQEIQKQPRRLTLGTVDGLQPDLIKNRPRSGNGQISDQLKNKVRKSLLVFETLIFHLLLFVYKLQVRKTRACIKPIKHPIIWSLFIFIVLRLTCRSNKFTESRFFSFGNYLFMVDLIIIDVLFSIARYQNGVLL